MRDPRLYQIALKHLHRIGPTKARMLVSYCGGVQEVFMASKKELLQIPGFSQTGIAKLNKTEALDKAAVELDFIDQNKVEVLFYLDKAYPRRLTHCNDAPLVLYTKGKMNLNTEKSVAIIGTRNITSYGKAIVEKLVRDLKKHNPLIVSGLAYGVDVYAHREALKNGLQTVGVMGNSLDRIYPAEHESTAKTMLENGGVISEFDSGTKPDAKNFPQRNRIVAGMADLVVVVETANKGGSMITARLAHDYNRDVAAFPGPIGAEFSKGCNHLIKTNQANLIESVKDIEYLMSWEKDDQPKQVQAQLFVDLNEEEKMLFDYLQQHQKSSLDAISFSCNIPVSKASTVLLELEFKGVVQSLPGKMFQLV